ncbi:MAG TPA: hypothetical protein VGN44_01225, partial [Candidatus Angelobacter sp.]
MVYDINQFMHSTHATFGSNLERLRRLQYTTENFNALKGLMTAALGVELLAFRMSDLLKQSWLGFLMSVVGILVGIFAVRRLPSYYERRFGQVEQQSRPMTRGQAIGCLSVIVGVLVFLVFSGPLGRFLRYIWTAINDHLNAMFAVPHHRLNFLPIFCWLVVLVMNIPFRHIHRVDLRSTSLWLGGTLVWGAVMLLPLRHPELVNLTWWKVLDDGWLYISL